MFCKLIKTKIFFRRLLIITCLWFIASACVPKVREFLYHETSVNYFGNITGQSLDDALIQEITGRNLSISFIMLSRMEITSISKNIFKSLSHIYTIDLSYNQITEIEDKSFEANSKLEILKLQGNKLLKISKNLFFGEFNDLTNLDLSFNGILSIEGGAFDNLVSLVTIDISQNCLKYLPSALFKKNVQLDNVELSNNEITKIEAHLFSSKIELKLIDLDHNKLDYVPNIAVKLIQNLILSNNEIEVLDLNFDTSENKKSAQIEQIILASNKMEEIVELDERRFDIKHLDLSNNSLTDFASMPDLINLRYLSLHNNSLTELDLHNFKSKFPLLNHFDVQQNNINCQDYHYLTENFDNILFLTDSTVRARCHNTSDDYESQIIDEIHQSTQIVVGHLIGNQNHLLLLLSGIIVILIGFCIILIIKQFKNSIKKYQVKLLEEIEL